MIWSPAHNRFVPELGPERYKSYSVSAPLRTHWRPGTCEEFECDEWVYGYVLTIDTSDDLGQKRYHYVTHDKSRKYSMQKVGDNLFKFIYGPGNNGMGHKDHPIPIGRPPFLLVAEGDFRGNPRGTPVRHHRTVENYIDDFATHQDRLAAAFNRG